MPAHCGDSTYRVLSRLDVASGVIILCPEGRYGEALAGGAGHTRRRDLSPPRRYAILALELFNHIAENAQYHYCAKEKCQRKVFIHQQGGARKGQHRSKEVDCCSPACAHAVAQRRYRKRHKNDRLENS